MDLEMPFEKFRLAVLCIDREIRLSIAFALGPPAEIYNQ